MTSCDRDQVISISYTEFMAGSFSLTSHLLLVLVSADICVYVGILRGEVMRYKVTISCKHFLA